jgi:hypothetical protein
MPAELWIPPSAEPKVSREHKENTREWEEQLLSMMHNEFVEPTSQMLEALRMCDLQNQRVIEDRDKAMLQAEAARLRAVAREEECRRDEGVERFLAASRTQVLMSPDVPWSQNNAPASRRDRGNRKKRR